MTHYTRLPATADGLPDQRCARCGDPIIPGRYTRWVHRPTSHAYDHEARTPREADAGLSPQFSSASRAARVTGGARTAPSVGAAHN